MSRLARLLNSSAEIWRDTRVSDGMGGWVSGWAKVGDARARFSQPSAAERVVAAQNGADLSTVAYLLPAADVRRDDELRRGAEVYEVLAVFEPSVPGTYKRANCRRRQEGV
ncbi:head-tail adaptor protein [Streptomyces afghaniensis]|uniref:phage head completion protein n=1 Tax=Streptomyces afghaniensis TaxID=66865 RepID=UPI0037D542A2